MNFRMNLDPAWNECVTFYSPFDRSLGDFYLVFCLVNSFKSHRYYAEPISKSRARIFCTIAGHMKRAKACRCCASSFSLLSFFKKKNRFYTATAKNITAMKLFGKRACSTAMQNNLVKFKLCCLRNLNCTHKCITVP